MTLPEHTPLQPAQRVVLVGYRGTGKSTIARLLAEQLGWAWLDADVELERRAGQTIREMFATQGEPAFRDLESAVLADVVTRTQVVLATGGGVILRPENRAHLRQAGPVVWLTATVATIVNRVAADANTSARRPNLTVQGGEAEIRHMLELREPWYREVASATIATDDRQPPEIVAEILAALQLCTK